MSEEPRKSPVRKPVIVVLAVLGVVVVAGGSFLGGMALERSRRASTQQQFFAERGFAPGGLAPFSDAPEGGFGAFGNPGAAVESAGLGRGAGGTVQSLEGDTLTLSGAQGEITVRLTGDTMINIMASGGRADLQPGVQVTAIGEQDDSGDITAAIIQIVSDVPQEQP